MDSGVWQASINNVCYRDSKRTWNIFDKETLAKTGSITGIESVGIDTRWNDLKFDVEYSFMPTTITGTAVGATLKIDHGCRSGCATGGNRSSGLAVDSTFSYLIHHVTTPTAGSPVDAIPRVSITLTGDDIDVPGYHEFVFPAARCDSEPKMKNNGGCRIKDVRPVWDIRSRGDLDEYRRHVRLAQDSGLPGKANNAGDGEPLTRGIHGIPQRRRITCGGVTGPRPAGTSCDEYPMASTKEGGLATGTRSGVPRTFAPEYCRIRDKGIEILGETDGRGFGYSVCLIDKAQNSKAGSLLTWFYFKNRIIDGDAYHVRVS